MEINYAICWIEFYLMDSAIQRLNNQGLYSLSVLFDMLPHRMMIKVKEQDVYRMNVYVAVDFLLKLIFVFPLF